MVATPLPICSSIMTTIALGQIFERLYGSRCAINLRARRRALGRRCSPGRQASLLLLISPIVPWTYTTACSPLACRAAIHACAWIAGREDYGVLQLAGPGVEYGCDPPLLCETRTATWPADEIGRA